MLQEWQALFDAPRLLQTLSERDACLRSDHRIVDGLGDGDGAPQPWLGLVDAPAPPVRPAEDDQGEREIPGSNRGARGGPAPLATTEGRRRRRRLESDERAPRLHSSRRRVVTDHDLVGGERGFECRGYLGIRLDPLTGMPVLLPQGGQVCGRDRETGSRVERYAEPARCLALLPEAACPLSGRPRPAVRLGLDELPLAVPLAELLQVAECADVVRREEPGISSPLGCSAAQAAISTCASTRRLFGSSRTRRRGSTRA